MAISTDMTARERVSLYQNEIQKRTPPIDKHDAFMLKVYQTLLDSALEELDQIDQFSRRIQNNN